MKRVIGSHLDRTKQQIEAIVLLLAWFEPAAERLATRDEVLHRRVSVAIGALNARGFALYRSIATTEDDERLREIFVETQTFIEETSRPWFERVQPATRSQSNARKDAVP
jgi:hypothetical protein